MQQNRAFQLPRTTDTVTLSKHLPSSGARWSTGARGTRSSPGRPTRRSAPRHRRALDALCRWGPPAPPQVMHRLRTHAAGPQLPALTPRVGAARRRRPPSRGARPVPTAPPPAMQLPASRRSGWWRRLRAENAHSGAAGGSAAARPHAAAAAGTARRRLRRALGCRRGCGCQA